ncbi:nuclear transport factor 2 family protein [Flavisphingomonas formosensis]|uniref:nuclear transport factor 2 family protein n=1 Tax=Flavisphingomonas formosensis TaxID=861534 RepID=UPI0012F7436B|nr:nuclear transport factor 2 family protein [Sphingomonas formosensis]
MTNSSASSVENNKAVVLEFYRAASSGDIDTVAAIMREDFRVEGPAFLPWGGVHEGLDAVMNNLVIPLTGAIDIRSVIISSIYGEGDRVFVILEMVTHDGKTVTAGEDWRVEEGRLAAARVFWFDPTPFMNMPPVAGSDAF